MPYSVQFTLYVVIASLLGLFFLGLFLYGPIKRSLLRHQTLQMYYRTVRRVTLDNDFYLINHWSLADNEGDSGVHIDHIIFGDKFIYVIRDRYYQGAISAKAADASWIYYFKKNKKMYIDNPLINNHIRASRLATASGLDPKFFLSIVLVNDDCLVTPFANQGPDNFLVPLSRLGKFIAAKEKDPSVPAFTPEEIAGAVRDLAELNQSKSNGHD
jgi:hypothetical protein